MNEFVQKYTDYLTAELHLASDTISIYKRECVSFLKYLNDMRLDIVKIKSLQIVDYLVDFRKKGITQRTLTKVLCAIRSLFRYLVLEHIRNDDPTMWVQIPQKMRDIPAVLTVEEVRKMLDSIGSDTPLTIRDRALFELIYASGLRISEVNALTQAQLFLEQRLVRIIGKRNKERMVPFGEEAGYWMRQYLEFGRPHLVRPAYPTDKLFLNKFGREFSRKGIWKRFHELCASIGIDAKVHTLRHSAATHMLLGGADIRTIQEMLGHADIGTTQIYTHFEKDNLRQYHHAHHPRD